MGRRLRQNKSVRQTLERPMTPLSFFEWPPGCLQARVGRLEPYTDCWLHAIIWLILALIMTGLQGQSMNQGCYQRLGRLSWS